MVISDSLVKEKVQVSNFLILGGRCPICKKIPIFKEKRILCSACGWEKCKNIL